MSTAPMGGKATAAAIQLGLAQAVKVGTTFISTIIVARILTPGDYGVIAMAAPVTAFILLFQNLGLNHAVVQAREVSSEQLNALFWVNIFASIVIAVALVLVSPVAAWFYGDLRAGYIVAASAMIVLMSGTALQHGALLNREMRFRALSRITIAASVTGLVVTVAAAFALRSYWALWWGGFAGGVASVILQWRSSAWRPSWHVTVRGTRKMLQFGAGITSFNILNFFSRNLDNVLIARFSGAAALGLYDRAYRLMMFPLENINSPLSRLMLPLLAKLKDEPERFRRAFLLAVRAIQLAVIPGVAVAFATSDRLIPFLLGPQWAGASPIFSWLALAALIQPLSNATGWLFITSGRTTAMAQWGLFSSFTTVLGFIVGLQWGPVGVAASIFVVTALRLPILYSWCVLGTSVRASDLSWVLLPPWFGAVITCVLVKLFDPYVSIGPLLLLALPLSYIVAVAVHALSPSGRELLRTTYDVAGNWWRPSKPEPPVDELSLDALVARSLPRTDTAALNAYNATGIAFVHIPKNAGTSIERALYGQKLGHRTWSELRALDRDRFDSWLKFAVIRDPVERFLSAFDYLSRGGRNRHDAEFSRRFVAGRDVNELALSLPSPAMRWFHLRPQSDYVLSEDGIVMVDRLVAFERLPVGIPGNPPLERFNVTEGDRTHPTALTAEAHANLEKVYKFDFVLHEMTRSERDEVFGTPIKANL